MATCDLPKSPSDPDARIAKMKDGRTHMAYKTEPAIDVDTDIVLAAEVYKGDESDSATFSETLIKAQTHMVVAGSEAPINDAIADKGYHGTANLVWCEEFGLCSYIPERAGRWRRKWRDKPASHRRAIYGNRRRVKGDQGKRLGRLRSEYVERSFAHACEAGGARCNWLHGLEAMTKRYLMYVAGKHLGVIMRALFGMGKPKTLQAEGGNGLALICWEPVVVFGVYHPSVADFAHRIEMAKFPLPETLARHARFLPRVALAGASKRTMSTGC